MRYALLAVLLAGCCKPCQECSCENIAQSEPAVATADVVKSTFTVTPLKRYSGTRGKCPKCGHIGASTAHETLNWHFPEYDLRAGESILIRGCKLCGYSWYERPLDEGGRP